MSLQLQSLRLRLTIMFLLVFTIVFGGLLTGAYALHRNTTRRLLDQQLENLAGDVASNVADPTASAVSAGLGSFQPPNRVFVILAVRDAGGVVLASRSLVDTDALPPLPDRDHAEPFAIRSIEGDIARRLIGRDITSRMITYRFDMPNGEERWIDLARTTDFDREERTFLFDMLAYGALGSVIAAGLAAWMIAGRAVSPMVEFRKAAEGIHPEKMDSRVDVSDKTEEVEALENALNEALQRLEDAFRSQGRFINNVSHDLKTPISVMLAESQVLRPESATLDQYEEYRRSMVSEMQRLGGLVESFLTLARADQGDAVARMTEVSPIDVLMEAVAECDTEAAHWEVRLVPRISGSEEAHEDSIILGDSDLLRAMLVNLIRNAIRHSPAGESIDVNLSCDDDSVRFIVRDRGPGIDQELHEKVFERFMQGPKDRDEGAGSGIGLAIAKSVAVLHRGTITVENCAGCGCEFVVTMPRQSPQFSEQQAGMSES